MSAKFDDSRGAERLGSADILVVVFTCCRDATTEFAVVAGGAVLAKTAQSSKHSDRTGQHFGKTGA
jgi:hypothetical protein